MIRSMTGFASHSVSLTLSSGIKSTLTIDIKSLNSRFFETTFKLPYQLGRLELEFVKILKTALYRGHLYFNIHVDNQNLFKGSVEPSIPTVTGYQQALNEIKKQCTIEGDLSISTLLLLPNVFVIAEKDLEPSAKESILEHVRSLVAEIIKAQEKEGQELKKDLQSRIAAIEKNLTDIEQLSIGLADRQRTKVQQALQEVSIVDKDRMAELEKQAAYVLLEKMDINEELVRFKSHLKNFGVTLENSAIEKGKRLDFTLQELAREINTIAAKCSDASIGAAAINIKVELEKAREQTQNIV